MNNDDLRLSQESIIRDKLGSSVNELLKTFIDSQVKSKELTFYTGKIVDNNDPLREGRCKIRVFGKYTDEIPDSDLPFATPDFNFIGSSMGSFIVPPVNSLVKVYFDNDDFYSPRYTTKVFNKSQFNFSAGINEDYPNTMVFFETDSGEYFKINRKTGQTTYRHVSGMILQIDSEGNIELTNDDTDTGNFNINIKGDLNIKVGGSTNITSNNNLVLKSNDTTVQGNSNIRFKFPQFAQWYPNALPNDPFSTVPHGGVQAGITSLTSEPPI